MQPAGASFPDAYPLQHRDGQAAVLQLSEADYRRASFLDERLLQQAAPPQLRPWAELLDAAPAAPDLHFIFHIGHVGSTLLSRLVGEHPELFSVREPALLRRLALGEPSPPAGELARVFGRVWRSHQTAVVKATSFVSEAGRDLMAAAGRGQAVLLAVAPPVYLRGILAGSASPAEAEQLAAPRQARLERRLGRPAPTASLGERIALGWLCETLALRDIAAAAPQRCLWLDFEQMLAAPGPAVTRVLDGFGVPLDAGFVETLVAGPIMGRYAKAPEHGYDAALRRQLLEQAGRDHALELRAGMDWLGRLMREHPAVQAALEHSAAMSRKPETRALA